MAVERLAPDAILAQSNLTGTVTAIQDDPDSPDVLWLTASGNNVQTSVRVSFPTPSLPRMTATQGFRILVRKSTLSGTGTPTAVAELWQAGVLVSSSASVNVTGPIVFEYVWDGTGRPVADIECRVIGNQSGGGPSVRASVDVGAIEWNADVTVPPVYTRTASDSAGVTDAATRVVIAPNRPPVVDVGVDASVTIDQPFSRLATVTDDGQDKTTDFSLAADTVGTASGTWIPQAGPYTLFAWAKPDSTGELGNGRIFNKAPGDTVGAMQVFLESPIGGGNGYRVWARHAAVEGTSRDRITGDGYAPQGVWSPVIVTLAATDTAPHVYAADGTEVTYSSEATFNTTAWTNTDALTVGNTASLSRAFDGRLAHVAVWDRVLSQSERAALGGGAQPSTIPSGLVAYWRMTDAGNQSDASGNGRTLAMSGGALVDERPPVNLVHQWTIASAPPGSTATLTGATTLTVGLTPDVAGTYVLRLTSTDQSGLSAFDELTLTATGGAAVRTASDTAGASDAAARAIVVSRAASDAAPASDGVAGEVTLLRRTANDLGAIGESVDGLAIITRSTSDTASATDSVTRVAPKFRTGSDIASATDLAGSTILLFRRTGNDISAPGDASDAVKMVARTADDTAAADDVATRSAPKLRTATDAAGATDAGSRLVLGFRTATDGAGASDALIHQAVHLRSVADTAGGSDALSHLTTLGRTASDGAPASDLVASDTLLLRRTANDLSGVIDSVDGFAVIAREASDAIAGLSDTAGGLALQGRSTSDSAPASDSATRVAPKLREATDDAGASDSATRVAPKLRTADDVASVGETAERSLVQGRTGSDTASVDDALQHLTSHPRSAADTAGASDVVIHQASLARVVSDMAGAADVAVGETARFLSRFASDDGPASDLVASDILLFRRTANDLSLLGDAADGLAVAIRTAGDSASASDAADGSRRQVRSGLDNLTPGETIQERMVSYALMAFDSVGVTDSASRSVVLARTPSDTASVGESVVTVRSYVRSTAEALATSSSASRSTVVARLVSDAVPATETATRTPTIRRSSLDVLVLPTDQAMRFIPLTGVTHVRSGQEVLARVNAPRVVLIDGEPAVRLAPSVYQRV